MAWEKEGYKIILDRLIKVDKQLKQIPTENTEETEQYYARLFSFVAGVCRGVLSREK